MYSILNNVSVTVLIVLILCLSHELIGIVCGGTVVKNPSADTGDTGHSGSIPGSGTPSRGGNGNLFQYSCPGNPCTEEGHQLLHMTK